MTAEKWTQIERLDLKHVKQKLLSRKSLWQRLWLDVDRVEKEYKQFLYLIAVNPGDVVVPWSEAVDELWHEHILDTVKYAADCEALFGRFIHHNPHLAVGSAAQRRAYQDTQTMYRHAFGEKASQSAMLSSHSPGATFGAGVGCSTPMPIVFCAAFSSGAAHHNGDGHGSDGHCGDGGSSCGSGGGASCGGASCGGGAGCGGGGCGGGGCGGGS